MQNSSSEENQIQAIQSMLAAGHTSIQLERHTFMLWGLAAAFLILAVPELFSQERFPVHSLRLISQNAFIIVVLLAVGYLDYRWTLEKRARLDETVSFVQRQITKVWWMLIALVVVINIGMNLYGGGSLFFGISLVLVGIALYVHGLFSRQMLCWGGGLLMAVGLALLAVSPSIQVQEWVAASAFGIGLPALSFMVGNTSTQSYRGAEVVLSTIWLALVLSPVAAAVAIDRGDFVQPREITLRDYLSGEPFEHTDPFAVALPAGTKIPVGIEITGDTLVPTEPTVITMQLTQPVSVFVEDGLAGKKFRVGQGRWKEGYEYRMRNWEVKGRMAPGREPELNLSLNLVMGD